MYLPAVSLIVFFSVLLLKVLQEAAGIVTGFVLFVFEWAKGTFLLLSGLPWCQCTLLMGGDRMRELKHKIDFKSLQNTLNILRRLHKDHLDKWLF